MAPDIAGMHAPHPPRPFYRHLYFQVLVAIAAGILLGHFYPTLGASLKPLGDAFVKLVKMIIAPVIFLTVVIGIASMHDLEKVGRVAGKALIYFLVVSTFALIIGLIVANVVQPGAGLHIDPATLDPKAVADYTAKAHDQNVVDFLMNIIPTTPVSALAGGDVLQVLFFSVLFGIALASTLFIAVTLWIIEGFETRVRTFLLTVKLGENTSARRADVEKLIEKAGAQYELRTTSGEELSYLVTAGASLKTERLSAALSALVPEGKAQIEWKEDTKARPLPEKDQE